MSGAKVISAPKASTVSTSAGASNQPDDRQSGQDCSQKCQRPRRDNQKKRFANWHAPGIKGDSVSPTEPAKRILRQQKKGCVGDDAILIHRQQCRWFEERHCNPDRKTVVRIDVVHSQRTHPRHHEHSRYRPREWKLSHPHAQFFTMSGGVNLQSSRPETGE